MYQNVQPESLTKEQGLPQLEKIVDYLKTNISKTEDCINSIGTKLNRIKRVEHVISMCQKEQFDDDKNKDLPNDVLDDIFMLIEKLNNNLSILQTFEKHLTGIVG